MTLSSLHRDVRSRRNDRDAGFLQRFFKTGPGEYGEGDRFLGIRVPVLRQLSRTYRDLELTDLELLLRSPWHEERALALMILVRRCRTADEAHRRALYRLYRRSARFVNNWDLVDMSASQLLGACVGGDRRVLRRLARSRLVWERRMAVIATFHYIKDDDFDDALAIATMLRNDTHDLIHKAVGWMLREVGKRNETVERRFLDRYAATMPLTMLRYAIERFAPKVRARYMRMGHLDRGARGGQRRINGRRRYSVGIAVTGSGSMASGRRRATART